jgi:hypothetical protein
MSYLINLTINSYNSWLYMWVVKLMYGSLILSLILLEFVLQPAQSRLQTNGLFFLSSYVSS